MKWLAGFLFLFTSAAFAAPNEVRAGYKLYRGNLLIASVEEVFSRSGDSYHITSTSQTLGLAALLYNEKITIKSEGRITASGLMPTQYHFARERNSSKAVQARFDWAQQQIDSQHDGMRETFALPAGMQDRLSVMYQFMFAPPKSAEISAWMSQGKEAEQYRYVRLGEEKLKTPVGEFSALHFSRVTKDGKNQVEVWLAQDRFFLPVRITFTDRNGSFVQELVSLSTTPANP
ncbi:MAG: DUF3108 domain-containing protein [Betaproteobacteria bacterium]|nr:DUF3108 domain-containing protein [Betaproteobacteria bacterium]